MRDVGIVAIAVMLALAGCGRPSATTNSYDVPDNTANAMADGSVPGMGDAELNDDMAQAVNDDILLGAYSAQEDATGPLAGTNSGTAR